MATYTSVQDGPWNDPNTWGGGGWPNANGDIINYSHKINYNLGVSSLQFNNITGNGGRLEIPLNVDSVLGFDATGILTLNNGAGFGGVDSGIIEASKYCHIKWPKGSYRYVFTLNQGGIFDLKGDQSFYGNMKYVTLKSNWDAGATLTLYVEGDVSDKWISGQKFWIHKYSFYSSYTTDSEVFEIDTVGAYDDINNKTPITVTNNGSGQTFNSGTFLIMLSRNVILGDQDVGWNQWGHQAYGPNIIFTNYQSGTMDNIDVEDLLFMGWSIAAGNTGYNYKCTRTVFFNNNKVIGQASFPIMDADFISNYNGIEKTKRATVTGKIGGCAYAMQHPDNCEFHGTIIGNYYAVDKGRSSRFVGDIIGNQSGNINIDNNGANHSFVGNFMYNAIGMKNTQANVIGDFKNNGTALQTVINSIIEGDFENNTNDIRDYCRKLIIGGNFPNGLTINMSDLSFKRSVILEESTISGIRRPIRIYENSGTILPLINTDAGWQIPLSDDDIIFKMIPNSYCKNNWTNQLEFSPTGKLYQYFLAGVNVILYKIFPVGWTIPLNQDDILIEARYIPDGGITRSVAVTSSGEFQNDDWRNLSVTFTAGQSQIVYFQIKLTRFESGAYVLVDPTPSFV